MHSAGGGDVTDRRRYFLIGLGVVVAVTAVTLLVTGGGGASNPSGATASLTVPVDEALCRALESAGSGDAAAAYGAFLTVHPSIHQLAPQVTAADRRAAAELLEAKAAAEEAFASEAVTLASDLRRLVEANRAAARVLNDDLRPEC